MNCQAAELKNLSSSKYINHASRNTSLVFYICICMHTYTQTFIKIYLDYIVYIVTWKITKAKM